MISKSTAIVLALFCAVAGSARAQLAWEKTEVELHPASTDATAVGNFKYQNKGDKPVHISSVHTSCGCTTAGVQKNDVAPGEKGEITATFNIGGRTGVQTKTVTVTTDDPKQPTTLLTLKAVIAQGLELQPALVFWESGEASKPKTITVKTSKEMPVKSLDVASSNPDFSTKVESGPGEGEFRINVQPRETTRTMNATLTIKPEPSAGGAKAYYATARVTPGSAAPQP
ncbi:MAG: DUF1573 domain-containing protein [Verrucomicrobiota bacterium]|nr:DUF1573 domain-containing protein [Verrucomicrobiota bacterium]